jgi:hypothetical protein
MHVRAIVATFVTIGLASGALAGDLPPRGKARLLRWLEAGTYRLNYVPEPALHPSTPAHGVNVRTWLSPRLVEDLAAGRPTFRRGAAMVKELYFAGDTEVVGWSVMRKLRRRSGRTGRGWFFYESFDGTNATAIAGRGVRVCTSCHAAGEDFLLSPFRPAVPSSE